jgi:hypothetical protein
MTERPVFVPIAVGTQLVQEIPVDFQWNRGMAISQKKKNVAALHAAAASKGLTPLLEVSSKSDHEVGRRLSAFSLKVTLNGIETTVESAFQGSKIFENGGPFSDLYSAPSRDARKDPRLQSSGRLLGFRVDKQDFPLSPTTAFYDWLYLNALTPHRAWLVRLQQFAGFTDIEFNPGRSLNCQARSCATFVALEKRGLLDKAMSSFNEFTDLLKASAI